MRRRTLTIAGCLELLAIALAHWQALGGVRTDEAKYLLNIPYPHPPLMRWIFSATEWIPFHEMFWRVILASLLVQGVWLVWDLCRDLRPQDRAAASVGWLLSSALLLQAGSVMLSPVAAVQALCWLWLRRRPDIIKHWPLVTGLFWTATVFSSFQGIFFAPLAWHAFRRGGLPRKTAALYVWGPIVLLGLWAMTNPLALATIIIHKNEGVIKTVAERLLGLGKLWAVGGGLIGSLFGTWGILVSRDRMLQASFALVCLYILGSVPYPFYAILFTPLFVGGMIALFHQKRHPHGFPLVSALVAGSMVVTWLVKPAMDPSTARLTMKEIDTYGHDMRIILISGSFGHQWQYETRATVRRYLPQLAQGADGIVCLNPCSPMFRIGTWKRLIDAPVETWVRR